MSDHIMVVLLCTTINLTLLYYVIDRTTIELVH